MVKKMNSQKIVTMIREDELFDEEKDVFLFKNDDKDKFYETIELLKKENYKLIDINEYAIIKPEDYQISLMTAGYNTDDENATFNDCLISDIKKRRQILKYKLNSLENVIDKHTVLIIRYNDLYLKDEMFYDGNNNMLYGLIRNWLKNGYWFNGDYSDLSLFALVLLETEEQMSDFCEYGFICQ